MQQHAVGILSQLMSASTSKFKFKLYGKIVASRFYGSTVLHSLGLLNPDQLKTSYRIEKKNNHLPQANLTKCPVARAARGFIPCVMETPKNIRKDSRNLAQRCCVPHLLPSTASFVPSGLKTMVVAWHSGARAWREALRAGVSESHMYTKGP